VKVDEGFGVKNFIVLNYRNATRVFTKIDTDANSGKVAVKELL
jgi:predicted NAD/FAD-binding protein